MPKAKAKQKRKSTGKKNRVPSVKNPDIVAELHCLLNWDAIPLMADKLMQFLVDKSEWQANYRKSFKEGTDPPVLAPSKIPNPNSGRMSRTANDRLVDEYNEALEAGEAVLPANPPCYCPVQQELISAIGCTVIRRGKITEQPENWNEKKWGKWYHEDVDGERTVPSGWLIDSESQRCFHSSIDKIVENPADNIVSIGGVRYVIGSGPKSSDAALYQIDCFKRGNYWAIWDVRRRLCMAKVKGITNLVFRIEDSPNAGSCVKIDMIGNGSFNFFMPGQVATPGYLINDGKEMNAAQVRRASADGIKGIKFKPLKEAIVSEVVWVDDAWPEIKKAWKASKRKETEENIVTQNRVSHDEGNPFGFRAASIGVVPFKCWEFDGSKYHFGMGLVVGSRVNEEYHTSKHEALVAWQEANPDADVEGEGEAVEAEAPKPKAKQKVKKANPAKPKLKIVVEDEPAPPIEDVAADQEEEALDKSQREAAEADVAANSDE